ncbi:MAG: FliH/SctL family protein [Sorangiineae bacterium]|nr:FliH/SctL family protein [Polyangiaceae bacterium]MEB2322363.1 FliH/SctL family protein [Sorangiineae bacterium]
MSVTRGRVLRASELGRVTPVSARAAAPRKARARVEPAEWVDAALRARALVERAEARARELMADAEREVASVRLGAEAEGRADAAAALAARAVALEVHEARADARALDRLVELARLLAERVLGAELRQSPEQLAALARTILAEARGARRATFVAHPEDAAVLGRVIDSLGLDRAALRIAEDPARERGSLRVETDIGALDGALAPQLERLARRLRESLG